MSFQEDIPISLASVRAEINAASKNAGRPVNDTTLVAVGKTFEAQYMIPALESGQRVFGENRVQEAEDKWPDLRALYPDIELHLIGPLQTNKIKQALDVFDVIETIDRPKLAIKLAGELAGRDKKPQCFIQINTGEETQKAGVFPKGADEFIQMCIKDLKLPVVGLMCIPPVDQEPSLHFALLHKIATRNGLKKLSMGMSADFKMAIELGATHVRVGSAIFGKRDYPIAD